LFDMTTTWQEAASAGHGARAIEDRATRRAIADARERQPLSPLAAPAQLDLAGYLNTLCSDVAFAFGLANGVQLGCAVSDGRLPAATAIRLGLIADELIENASTAFPPVAAAGSRSASRPRPMPGCSWWRTAASACRRARRPGPA
jgi:two-component sensor histidine kinase